MSKRKKKKTVSLSENDRLQCRIEALYRVTYAAANALLEEVKDREVEGSLVYTKEISKLLVSTFNPVILDLGTTITKRELLYSYIDKISNSLKEIVNLELLIIESLLFLKNEVKYIHLKLFTEDTMKLISKLSELLNSEDTFKVNSIIYRIVFDKDREKVKLIKNIEE